MREVNTINFTHKEVSMGITHKETVIMANNSNSGTEAETNTSKKDIIHERVSHTVATKTSMVSIITNIFTGTTSLKEPFKIIVNAEMKSLSLRILINIYNLNSLIKERDFIFTEILFTILPSKLNFLTQTTINSNNLENISHLLPMITVHNRSTIPIFQVTNMTVTSIILKVWILLNMRGNKHIHRMKHQKNTIIKELIASTQWILANRVLILRKCSIITVQKETISFLNNKWT